MTSKLGIIALPKPMVPKPMSFCYKRISDIFITYHTLFFIGSIFLTLVRNLSFNVYKVIEKKLVVFD